MDDLVKNRINNIRNRADDYINYEQLIKDIARADENKKPNYDKISDIQVLASEYIDLDYLIIEIMRACNYTYQEIGEVYGTSRQAVFNKVKYHGLI